MGQSRRILARLKKETSPTTVGTRTRLSVFIATPPSPLGIVNIMAFRVRKSERTGGESNWARGCVGGEKGGSNSDGDERGAQNDN